MNEASSSIPVSSPPTFNPASLGAQPETTPIAFNVPSFLEDLFRSSGGAASYSFIEIIINLSLAFLLCVVVSVVYTKTHKGLSYSQSFAHTIVFVGVIVAVVMMIIGGSLARAFALVGALSIIRFRTVVKDTKDTAFIFASLAAGMAAGTSNYLLALVGTGFIIGVAYTLYWTNFGATYKSNFLLRFMFKGDTDSEPYIAKLNEHASKHKLLNLEAAGDGATTLLTYDIALKAGKNANQLVADINEIEGISEVMLIAAKADVDY